MNLMVLRELTAQLLVGELGMIAGEDFKPPSRQRLAALRFAGYAPGGLRSHVRL